MIILSLLFLVVEPTSLDKCEEVLKGMNTISIRDGEKRAVLYEKVFLLAGSGKFDEAIPLMQKLIVTSKDALEKTKLHTNLAILFKEKGEIKKALHLLNDNLNYQEECSYLSEQVDTLEEIAKCYLLQNRYEEALQPAMQAKRVQEMLQVTSEEKLKIRELLGQIHQKLSIYYLNS